VRVLIFHGYLLHGTGSNVYNARLAEALKRAGHEVHLLCQEGDPRSLHWVDAAVELGPDAAVDAVPEGRAVVWRPDIAGVLPVYVPDRYEGFDARPLYELTEAEVDRYVERNVAAVRAVAEAVRPDVALANHLVMGPLVLSRALDDVPYAVKIHGSALEYVVKPHPRFLPHAREGLARARGILVGSRHTGESLWAALPEARERTRLGPPGVDVEAFAPREDAWERLVALREREVAAGGGGSFARAHGEAAAALAAIEPEDRLVVFVGKLIGSKGVELLLAAWPLVLAAEPRARLVVVGFGGFREGLEALQAALEAGDLDAARATVAEDGRSFDELQAFLARPSLPPSGRVAFAGRMDHDELVDLLPAAEAIVVPSTFPEAFGMVAAEGAACGTLPVVARHSGLAEVSEALAAAVPEAVRPFLSFTVGPAAVDELAAALVGWLQAPEDVRAAAREAIVGVTRERWSWDGVARTVLDAAQGRLEGLPTP
jgi:glycosyltransferase involved in cell wall biosynthesis